MVVTNWKGKQDYLAIGDYTIAEICETLGLDPLQVSSIRMDSREVVVFGTTPGQTLRIPVRHDM